MAEAAIAKALIQLDSEDDAEAKAAVAALVKFGSASVAPIRAWLREQRAPSFRELWGDRDDSERQSPEQLLPPWARKRPTRLETPADRELGELVEADPEPVEARGRANAMTVLRELGAAATPALAEFAMDLHEGLPARQQLERLGTAAARVLEAELARLPRDAHEPGAALWTAWACTKVPLPPPVADLAFAGFASPSAELANAALLALVKCGGEYASTAALALLDGSDLDTCRLATAYFGLSDSKTPGTHAKLLAGLRAKDLTLATWSAYAATRVANGDIEVTSTLTELRGLASAGPAEVRESALLGLGRLGPAAKGARGVVLAALADRFPFARLAALRALPRLGPASADLLELVGPLLRDRADIVRAEARQILLWIGLPALDLLFAQFEDLENPVADGYELAQRIGELGEPTLEKFRTLAEHEDSERRTLAAVGLAAALRTTKAALPTLLVLARDTESTVRCAALRGFGLAREALGETMPLLARALQSEDPEERAISIRAIATLGEPAKALAQDLGKLLGAGAPDEDMTVLLALRSFGKHAAPARREIELYLASDAGKDPENVRAVTIGKEILTLLDAGK